MRLIKIALLCIVTFVFRIPTNIILVKLFSLLAVYSKSNDKQRIGIDAQILQFRSAKRGIGSYGYRLLDEFPQNNNCCLVVTATGHIGKTLKIVKFAIGHKMQMKIIYPGVISPWEESARKLNEVSSRWSRILEGFNFNSILYLAALALPHEVIFEIPAIRDKKLRFVIFYDNFLLLDSFSWKNPLFKAEVMRRMSQFTEVSIILCISEFAKKTLPANLQQNTIIIPKLSPNKSLKTKLYKRSGFLVVARNSPHKNLSLAINAFGHLDYEDRKRNPLKIVGIDKKTLCDLTNAHSQRKFIRVKKNLTERKLKFEMQSCELIIIPSLMEGLGLLAIEGLEFGNLVTCSKNIPANHYVVDGRLLFEHDDAISLFRIMARILHDSAFTSEMRSKIGKKILETQTQPSGRFIYERLSN